VESAIKECEQLSGIVCKPKKYRQHGTILNAVKIVIEEFFVDVVTNHIHVVC
jgi:hypothetical protein